MKPEIEWICTTSGVDKTMPVIRASEYKHKWQMKAVQDMKQMDHFQQNIDESGKCKTLN